jgi:outer membrane autotransporter protein
MMRVLTRLMMLLILMPKTLLAEDTRGWLIRAYGGYSLLDDQNVDSRGIGDGAASGDVEVDGGYTAGLGVGYRYSDRLEVELAWEYRSHDSEVKLDNGERYDDGDYASNTFWLNGRYSFSSAGPWRPYLGAGVGYIEEIDIDLDRRGEKERSFSDDGDIAWQIFAGVDYELTDAWILQGEVRYSFLDDVTLDEESGSGRLSGLDYDPVTFQLGVVYRF